MDPSYTSEEILQTTFAGLETFLQNTLDPNSFQAFLIQKNNLFPTWNHLWERLYFFLVNHSLSRREETISSLAHMLSADESFHRNLQNSLTFHETFWNQVYLNLLAAKERIQC